MLLYTNGDSHTAGAETVSYFCFAEDDTRYRHLGRQPHPDCIKLSYGYKLSQKLGAEFATGAESASSNDRIIRSTREYLKSNTPDLIIIGWTSWEREEWWHEATGKYWQVSAWLPGRDWPDEIKNKHREWVLSVDYDTKRREWNNKIWEFHKEIEHIPHLFFNCFTGLSKTPEHDWGDSYLHPYEDFGSYQNYLQINGFKTVSPESHHFGEDAHSKWADYLLPMLTHKS